MERVDQNGAVLPSPPPPLIQILAKKMFACLNCRTTSDLPKNDLNK